jgi:peptide deformylase
MIRKILKLGAPELEKACAPVTSFDAALKQLVEDMFETMYSARGVGLAAPQIGVDQRLVVMDVSGGQEEGRQIVMANPEIIAQEGVQRDEEGCLSIPEFTAIVERPYKVTVRAQDIDGQPFEITGEALQARAFCHEIDHINGVLYLDRVSVFRRDLIKRKIKKLIRAGQW